MHSIDALLAKGKPKEVISLIPAEYNPISNSTEVTGKAFTFEQFLQEFAPAA